MGNVPRKPLFSTLPETELLKLYFTSSSNYTKDDHIHNLNIKLPNGENMKNVTSIVYYIQFISNNNVVEEISIKCSYSFNTPFVKLKLCQHIKSNTVPEYQIREIYEYIRIGFPVRPFISSDDIYINFSRLGFNTFIISMKRNNADDNINIGILSFKNINPKDMVYIEPVVKCVVRTKVNISLSGIKNLTFILFSPIVNDNNDRLQLTNQYRLSTSIDKVNNTINVFDIGIDNIQFEGKKAIVYSLTSNPKTQIAVSYQDCDEMLGYIFKEYDIVY
jgi:hypothetical protein